MASFPVDGLSGRYHFISHLYAAVSWPLLVMFVVWPPLGPLCSRSCSDPVRPSSVCHWFSILASLSGRCSVILVPIRSSLLFPLLPSVVPAIDVRSGCCLVWLNLSNRYAFSGPIVSDEIRLSVCLIRSGPSSFCTCSSGRRSSDRLDSASVAVRPRPLLSGHFCRFYAFRPLFGCLSVVSQPCVRSVFPVICPAAPATCPSMFVVFRSVPFGSPTVCTD